MVDSEEPPPDDKVFGFAADAWERLPQWLQTFITESHERAANAAHEQHRQSVQSQWDQSWKSADLVLRTLITIEGGSLVAILAFLGVLAERGTAVDIQPLLISLGAIGAALIFAVLAGFASYFVSAWYGEAFENRLIQFEHPFVHDTEASLRAWRRGGAARVVGIVCAAGSLVAMAGGVIAFGAFIAEALANRPTPSLAAGDLIAAQRETRELTSTAPPTGPETIVATGPALAK
ncbi:hypothetical protein [Brevundimonas sp.]|uniref:hypothetical protein n=1 Tax=Brevundimonas sp. TaxID=1871086 RepID=UPI002FCA61E8